MTSFIKWRRTVAAVGALAMIATACGGSDDPDTGAEGENGGETEAEGEGSGNVLSSITVGINNPNYATQMAVVLADAYGYFEEVGITDVEIIETDEYIAGLIGGSLDITQGDTDAAFGSANTSGEEIIFTGTYRHGEYQILGVGPDISEPEDLIGQDITGGALGSRNQRLIERYLTELGVDPDEVNFVPQGGNSDATLQAIMSGTVAAGALFPRHKFALEEAGGQFIYEQFAENPQEGLLVMGDFYEENYDTVVAFWEATLKARQDMYEAIDDEEKKAEIYRIMREDYGFDIPEPFETVFQLEVEQVSPDGGFETDLMDALVEEQIELGNLPEDIDWRSYVDLTALHEAQERVGIDLRPASLD
ncbi:MAG: ABC transporter substrate-binding protein [Actinobacteria bacterium]|jgi:ABC-type nitrate/sulfonate/bicarbonate transport system substrate-binding protein|nr:ABC transporter substrate-binding protein [Actinomycetota bacterium]